MRRRQQQPVAVSPARRDLDFLRQVLNVGILIILFLPLFVNQNFLFPFVFPKTVLFRILVEIAFALYLALAVAYPVYRPRWSGLTIAIASFLGVMVVASWLGVDWYHSFWSSVERSEGILTWLHLAAFFIILSGVLRTKQDWRQVFGAIIIAGWLQSLFALGQALNLSFFIKTTGARIGGSLGNPSFLATYLLFIIAIAVFHYLQTSGWEKVSCAALVVLDLYLLWQTQTRGAIVALVFATLLFFGITVGRRKETAAKIIVLAAFLIFVGLIGFLIASREAPWVRQNPTLARLTSIPSAEDVSTQNRLIVWQVGWQGFLERPWLGWGWENFGAPFNKYFNPALARDIGSQPWYDRAHNVVVEVAVTTGILGLLAYLSIFGLAIRSLWRKNPQGMVPTGNLLFVIFLVVYLIQNFFVFDTLSSYLMLFVVLAFIQFQRSPKEVISGMNLTPSRPFRWAGALQAGTLALALLPLVYYFNIRPVLANRSTVLAVTKYRADVVEMQKNFERAFRYSPPNDQELRFVLVQYVRDQINLHGVSPENTPLIRFAINTMNQSLAVAPHGIQNYLLLAELYLAASPLDPQYLAQAEAITRKALAYAPHRYQMYTMLGRLKMSQAQFAEGIRYFQQATTLNSNFAEAYWNLAIAYILSGQAKSAQAPLDQALALGYHVYDPENIQKLLTAYRDARDLVAMIDFLRTLVARFPDDGQYRQALQSLEQLYQQAIEASGQQINRQP